MNINLIAPEIFILKSDTELLSFLWRMMEGMIPKDKLLQEYEIYTNKYSEKDLQGFQWILMDEEQVKEHNLKPEFINKRTLGRFTDSKDCYKAEQKILNRQDNIYS